MSISIVIPAFNSERYIAQCVESVYLNVNDEIEVIVIDDGSYDRTSEILVSLKLKYKGLIVIKQNNSGVTAARRVGVQNASYNWIMFIDSDDTLVEGYYDLISRDIKEYGERYQIYIYEMKYKSGDKVMYFDDEELHRDTIIERYIKSEIYSGPVGKIFDKRLFDGYVLDIPRNIFRGEDFLMNLALASKSKLIKIRNVPIYEYRIHDASVTSNYSFDYEYEKEYLEYLDFYVLKNKIPISKTNKKLLNIYLFLGILKMSILKGELKKKNIISMLRLESLWHVRFKIGWKNMMLLTLFLFPLSEILLNRFFKK